MNPAQSPLPIANYAVGLSADQGDKVSKRNLIYLDTRFWIHIRDASMRRAKKAEHTELLRLLRLGVSKGVFLCPASDVLCIEIYQQHDAHTRHATLRLLDELSLGATIVTEQERIRREIEIMMMEDFGQQPMRSKQDYIWTCPAFVYGTRIPVAHSLSPADQLQFQTIAIERLWAMNFTELSALLDEPPRVADHRSRTAHSLTISAKQFAHENNSFEHTILTELAGILRVFEEDILKVFQRIRTTKSGPYPDESGDARADTVQHLVNAIVNLFRHVPKKMQLRLPTVYVQAVCHAAFRWEKTKKLDGHDLADFHHASAAVAYCNAFFTDRSLRHFLKTYVLRPDSVFDVQIESDESAAIDCVQRYLSGDTR